MTGRDAALAAIRSFVDVSRETEERLDIYAESLGKWTRKINLVSAASIGDLWHRHIVDSAQLWPLAGGFTHWLDLGSGGGLPGLIIAAIAAEHAPGARVTLVESDARKGAFLAETARRMTLTPRIETERIETLEPQSADIVSARALAPLAELLALAAPHCGPDAVCLFPKGRRVDEELTAAKRVWQVDAVAVPSRTDPDAAILRIGAFSRV